MNYFKRLETGIIAVVILVLGVAFGVLNDKAAAPTLDQQAGNQQESNLGQSNEQVLTAALIRYPGQEGHTALDLLKQNHQVETQSFGGVGEFVKSIDGETPDASHFWAFYVNGQQAQVGADAYVTSSTDTIEWKLEEIK